MRKVPNIIQSGELYYEKYIPSIFRPFKVSFEKMTFRKKVRFAMQALRGSIVFYLKKEDLVLGYVVLEKGAGIRYPETTSLDWIISPYTVNPNERGKGYGTRILIDLKNVIHVYLGGNIYAEVRRNNEASKRAMDKAGYIFKHYAKQKGIFRSYVRCEGQSEYLVYKA